MHIYRERERETDRDRQRQTETERHAGAEWMHASMEESSLTAMALYRACLHVQTTECSLLLWFKIQIFRQVIDRPHIYTSVDLQLCIVYHAIKLYSKILEPKFGRATTRAKAFLPGHLPWHALV